jgi:hypothetical protein
MTEGYGKRELCSKAPNNSGVTISCDLGAEPDLRKIGEQGARSRKRNRPFAFMFDISRAIHRAAVLFGPRIESDIHELKEADCR